MIEFLLQKRFKSQIPKVSCIYCITNLSNNKKYIGQTTNIAKGINRLTLSSRFIRSSNNNTIIKV